VNAMTEVRHSIPALAMQETELLHVLQTSLYPGATNESIRMVIGYCKAAGLDPLQKPVHIVPMWDSKGGKMRDVIMPGVNLYRTQAARSGGLAGVTEPEFGPDATETLDGETITFPTWCRVTVKRRLATGEIADFTAIERWKENYAQKGGKEKSIAPNAMWKRRPYAQLAKCAQAQALRVAFPELAGGYTADEMEGKTIDGDRVEGEIFSPEQLKALIESAEKSTALPELEGIWKAGIAAILAAKDRPAADAFKDAVVNRRAQLKAASEEKIIDAEPGTQEAA
jgi:phage recombination protein Bet